MRVIVLTPFLNHRFSLLDGREPVLVHTFHAQLGVEGLNTWIVGRRAWATEVQFDPVLMSPYIERSAGELGAIIHTAAAWSQRCRWGSSSTGQGP
jgi:hypothetical protein